MGIYSAIDVAKKDIITEASANINISIENDSDTLGNISSLGESNISLPFLQSNIIKNYYEELELKPSNKKIGIEDNNVKKQSHITLKQNNEKLILNAKINSVDINNKTTLKPIQKETISSTNDKISTYDNSKKQNLNIKDKEKLDSFSNDTIIASLNDYPVAPKLDKKAKNFRFIASVDNELILMENVFKVINVKINDNDLVKVKSLLKYNSDIDVNSNEFFTNLKDRLNLLAIYKDALLFIPLKPPMEHYYISSQYGKRKHPVTGKYRMHHGIDLAGTWQENVSVSADGTVVFAGYHGSFGKVIRIKHRYGIMTTYGHLAKIKVKKGDIVNEGQVIGKMGRTGRVNGAHLHYEISVNGKSQNPNTYIKIGRNLLSRNSLKGFAKIN